MIDYATELDLQDLPSPCFVLHLGALQSNLETLARVQQDGDCKMLLALKAFAMWSVFPQIRESLSGTCASSLDEARLGAEEFGPVVHTFAPAFKDEEFEALLYYSSHISFNSLSQWQRHRPHLHDFPESASPGLRINPEHREVDVELYDPCAPRSRLGVRAETLTGADLEGIEGFHFHTLCEKNIDALERTLAVVEQKFGSYFKKLKWINMGGGHHITRSDYEVDRLIQLLNDFHGRHPHLKIFLEPGEAVALNAGVLVCTVMDLIDNEGPIAILDTSASTHMPDVLEMPYRPDILGAGQPNELDHTYRLGGMTCLAGDVIGDYSFAEPLEVGQQLIFADMAHYSMVKTTTFNGVRLPSIAIYDPASRETVIVREFWHDDYKMRLS